MYNSVQGLCGVEVCRFGPGKYGRAPVKAVPQAGVDNYVRGEPLVLVATGCCCGAALPGWLYVFPLV